MFLCNKKNKMRPKNHLDEIKKVTSDLKEEDFAEYVMDSKDHLMALWRSNTNDEVRPKNHLDEIEEIISALKKEKLDEFASVLRKIMDYTFSGTELILSVAHELNRFSKDRISLETQELMRKMVEKIDKFMHLGHW